MKNLKLFVVVLLIGTSSLFATEISKTENKNPNLEIQIKNLLNNNHFSFEREIEVAIKFTFNSDGQIIVTKVGTADQNILNFIRKNLNGKTVENPGVRDKVYSLSLKFKSKH